MLVARCKCISLNSIRSRGIQASSLCTHFSRPPTYARSSDLRPRSSRQATSPPAGAAGGATPAPAPPPQVPRSRGCVPARRLCCASAVDSFSRAPPSSSSGPFSLLSSSFARRYRAPPERVRSRRAGHYVEASFPRRERKSILQFFSLSFNFFRPQP